MKTVAAVGIGRQKTCIIKNAAVMRELRIKGREAAAVQIAAQQVCGLLHASDIKMLPPDSRGVWMQGLGLSREIVVIRSFRSIKTGMEIVGHRLNPADDNVVWEQAVEASAQTTGIDRFSCIKMGALAPGVYAGIGAAGARDSYICLKGNFQRFLYALLNAYGVGLNLPAGIAGSVIRNMKQVTRQVAEI